MATQTPPPDAARGATADLCDTFITDPVDIVNQGQVQIMDPVFRDFGGNLRKASFKMHRAVNFPSSPTASLLVPELTAVSRLWRKKARGAC